MTTPALSAPVQRDGAVDPAIDRHRSGPHVLDAMPGVAGPSRDSGREVLQAARTVTNRLGITRAVPITAFDKIGIPVWSTVRPTSAHLIVNGGKGLSDAAAEISARLECLEQAAAERPPADNQAHVLTLREASSFDSALLEYDSRPLITGARWNLDTPIHWVTVTDALRDCPSIAPVEAVHFPVPEGIRRGLPASSTRGLACGTSLEDAIVHGWYEVLERHAASLVRIGALDSRRLDVHLDLDTATGGSWSITRGILDRIGAAGVEPRVRIARFGSFWFAAVLLTDRDRPEERFHNGGYGLHLDPGSAVDAALLEAVQSRAGWIHGTRDDLPAKAPEAAALRHRRLDSLSAASPGHPGPGEVAGVVAANRGTTGAHAARLRTWFAAGPGIPVHDLTIPGFKSDEVSTTLDGIAALGFSAAYHSFAGDFGPFHVVRSLIPGAEDFSGHTPLVGRRLLHAMRRQSGRADSVDPEGL